MSSVHGYLHTFIILHHNPPPARLLLPTPPSCSCFLPNSHSHSHSTITSPSQALVPFPIRSLDFVPAVLLVLPRALTSQCLS